jgi:hypothetical protein
MSFSKRSRNRSGRRQPSMTFSTTSGFTGRWKDQGSSALLAITRGLNALPTGSFGTTVFQPR